MLPHYVTIDSSYVTKLHSIGVVRRTWDIWFIPHRGTSNVKKCRAGEEEKTELILILLDITQKFAHALHAFQ